MLHMLDRILENGPGKVTPHSVIQAIRAYSCLTDDNRWIDPPTRVEYAITTNWIGRLEGRYTEFGGRNYQTIDGPVTAGWNQIAATLEFAVRTLASLNPPAP